MVAKPQSITLRMATRRWRCTGTVRFREAIPLGKYWNVLANGVAGRYEPGSGNKLFYFKDHLGSTRTVVDAAGNVKEALDYAKGIPSGLPIRFTHARPHLPERQRDEGEVYGEGMGCGDPLGLLWGALLQPGDWAVAGGRPAGGKISFLLSLHLCI